MKLVIRWADGQRVTVTSSDALIVALRSRPGMMAEVRLLTPLPDL